MGHDLSRKSNKKPTGKRHLHDSKSVTPIDSEKVQKPFLSDGKEVILTRVGYLPPLKAPPIRKRKDIIPERTYDFETPPDPIRIDEIKENINAEVVVVGAGIAGLSAALSAAEAGAKTILLEKTATVQARGHDNAFIGSRLQEKLGIEIDKD
jgi:NADPH-dependent 2,4-dienoyl-CoA reductase/sulfur reductase-like enzyme